MSQPQKSSKASISTTPNQTELWPDLTSIYNQMVTSPEGGWRHSDRYTVTDMCQSVLLFGHPCTRLNKIYYMSHNKKLLSTAKPAPPMPSWTVAPGLPINPIPPFLWPSKFQCVDRILNDIANCMLNYWPNTPLQRHRIILMEDVLNFRLKIWRYVICILGMHSKVKSLLVWSLQIVNLRIFFFGNRCGERCFWGG